MAKFEPAVMWTIIKHEGGLTNNAHDNGGLTRWGITEEEAEKYGLDVRTLNINQAKSIYRAGYWRHDDLISQTVATKAFDIGVNVGVVTGIKLLQRAYNAVLARIQPIVVAGQPAELVEDGLLGPKSEAAINGAPDALMLDALRDVQVLYYADIINNNAKELNRLIATGKVPRNFKNQATFVLGWMRRALDLP